MKLLKPIFPVKKPRVKAVVLFSGGIDSLVSLVWARQELEPILAVSFDYGQTHVVELEAASRICKELDVPHRILSVPVLGEFSRGILTNRKAQPWDVDGQINRTMFVPGRNLVLLSLAAGLAVCHGAADLVVGEGQVDGKPFPDAMVGFFRRMQEALSLGMGQEIRIQTPLMGKTKGEGIRIGMQYPGFEKTLSLTVSCYHGARCQTCPACWLRNKGFLEIDMRDPARTPHRI